MPKKKLIWLLYPTYLFVVLLCLAPVAWIMINVDKKIYFQEIAKHMGAQTTLVEHILEPVLKTYDSAKLQTLCRDLGKEINARITVIAPDGQVLADSLENPAQMENHLDRPEIQLALKGQSQAVQRHSFTVQEEMIYLARLVYNQNRLQAVIRLSITESSFLKTIRAFYFPLLLYMGLIALAAMLISWFIARTLSRPLEEMQACAKAFADSRFDCALPSTPALEINSLAESLNEMAKKLNAYLQETVRQKNEREAILTSMQEGVLAVNNEEKIITLNESAAQLLEVNAARVTGFDFRAGIRQVDLQRFITHALQTQEPMQTELTIHASTERERNVLVTSALWIDESGQCRGVICVLSDISRIKALETIRRDFVANVSHELKTPITLIQGFVETMLDGAMENSAEAQKFLTTILKNAKRLHSIIEDLLSLSKIEQMDKTELAKEPIDLQNLLEQSLQNCERIAEDKKIKLELHVPDALSVNVNANLFEHAVTNLVENAIKYSPNDSVVLVEAREVGTDVQVTVRDWGCGISTDHLPRLFERFYRVDKGRSRQAGGTGLGLAIVKHIVQVHGGEVDVQSIIGQGSLFTIRLPQHEVSSRQGA